MHRMFKPEGATWGSGWKRTVPLLALYGAVVTPAMLIAGGGADVATWNPVAGVRLAMLCFVSARLIPHVALVEIALHLALFPAPPAPGGWAAALPPVVVPVAAYALTVAAIRWIVSGGRGATADRRIPFGLMAAAAPTVAALATLPGLLLNWSGKGIANAQHIATSLTALAVRDLSGIILLGPPLLWGLRSVGASRRQLRRVRARAAAWVRPLLECFVLLAAALFAVSVLVRIDIGSQPAPVILAVVAIGLRFGRFAVWASLVVIAGLILTAVGRNYVAVEQLQNQLDFTTIVVAGYLAGSYRDAQRRARLVLRRRDQLLFQAERLKTLRAMSVAVIHEISQPLSTLAIEAKHLHEITAHLQPEIAQTASLIDRKATTLSNLVRRLRRFGGGAVDEPSPLSIAALIEGVVALAGAEAKSEGVMLDVAPPDPALAVLGQEIELSQAVINLVRNALRATSDGTVRIVAERAGDEARITVVNRCALDSSGGAGMGVGTLVAQAIVEAHGGRLVRARAGEDVVASIWLPSIGGRP